jgi:hypothetical protein
MVTQRCPVHRDQPRSTSLTELVDLPGPLCQLTPRPRPYSFFAMISCRTWRSSEEIGDQPLQLPVLLAQLSEFPQLAQAQPAYFFFHR